jgi:DNA-binding MarR family transcriptional regulator
MRDALKAQSKNTSKLEGRAGAAWLDISRLNDALGFRVRMLEQVIAKSFARHLQPLDITPTLYSILVLIEDNALCRQTDLSQMLKMHQPNLVERVGVLVDRGLIARRVDPNDRRAYVLQLTFAGKHFMEKLAAAHEAHISEMKALLGEDGYRAILQALPASDIEWPPNGAAHT